MSNIQVKVLSDIPGYKTGQTIFVKVDSLGTPLDKFWRRRLKDAKTDNCLEVIKPSQKKSSKSKYSKVEDQENIE